TGPINSGCATSRLPQQNPDVDELALHHVRHIPDQEELALDPLTQPSTSNQLRVLSSPAINSTIHSSNISTTQSPQLKTQHLHYKFSHPTHLSKLPRHHNLLPRGPHWERLPVRIPK